MSSFPSPPPSPSPALLLEALRPTNQASHGSVKNTQGRDTRPTGALMGGDIQYIQWEALTGHRNLGHTGQRPAALTLRTDGSIRPPPPPTGGNEPPTDWHWVTCAQQAQPARRPPYTLPSCTALALPSPPPATTSHLCHLPRAPCPHCCILSTIKTAGGDTDPARYSLPRPHRCPIRRLAPSAVAAPSLPLKPVLPLCGLQPYNWEQLGATGSLQSPKCGSKRDVNNNSPSPLPPPRRPTAPFPRPALAPPSLLSCSPPHPSHTALSMHPSLMLAALAAPSPPLNETDTPLLQRQVPPPHRCCSDRLAPMVCRRYARRPYRPPYSRTAADMAAPPTSAGRPEAAAI